MDVAQGCLRNFHNDQARAGAAVPLRLTAASTGPRWDRPNGPRCAAAPYCRNLCLSCCICSLGAQALDCRYRGNPPVLTLMADMTFECASASPTAIPPGFLCASVPVLFQVVPALRCGCCILSVQSFSLVFGTNTHTHNHAVAFQGPLVDSVCERLEPLVALVGCRAFRACGCRGCFWLPHFACRKNPEVPIAR